VKMCSTCSGCVERVDGQMSDPVGGKSAASRERGCGARRARQ
jgi:hypothetical protein